MAGASVPIDQLLYGIRTVETGGEKNPYSTVNSIGATGAYQVMKGNIAAWTKQALGRAYTQAEFIASATAQDKVAAYFLGRDMQKYGWEGAASRWFSGQPDPNSTASDGGNTVRQYVDKVGKAMQSYGGGSTVPGGSTTATQAGLLTPLTDLTTVFSDIASGVVDIAKSFGGIAAVAQFLMKLALPTTWVRIAAGLAGAAFLLTGLLVLGREVKEGGKAA